MNNRTKAVLRWILINPIAILLSVEILARILGYQHFNNKNYSIQSSPPNAFVGHPRLGIQLNPGTYNIEVNHGLNFTTRHLDDHSRQVAGRAQSQTQVLLLGCSFTYGFGVDDEQTFASRIQQSRPALGIKNGGVVGYGSVQPLMQLREHIDSADLKVVLLHFSSFHFMRNTLSQQYRSNLKVGYDRSSRHVDGLMQQARFPCKESCAGTIVFVPWREMYANWPGRSWLASVNALQMAFDEALEDKDRQVEVTACIIKEMDALCRKNGIAFGVVCLDTTAQTEQLKQDLEGINWLDVHFDFKDKNLINHPYDSHPNPKGHQLIASKVQPFLGKLLDEK